MIKRFGRAGLNKLLGHEASPSEVVHSHAYGKVARKHPSAPRPRHVSSSRKQTVPGYRDSMVGSTIQYRDRIPVPPQAPEKDASTQSNDSVVGNRPHNSSASASKADAASIERRHHFIEPPKRHFNRFD